MKTRGTATDKLVDVIQALQLVRKSGRLTVQRDMSNGVAEVGVIVFREGQIIDATVGQMKGADAFKKLVVWTRCHFLFELAPPTAPPIAPPFPQPGVSPPTAPPITPPFPQPGVSPPSPRPGIVSPRSRSGALKNDAEWGYAQRHSDEYLAITSIPYHSYSMQETLPDFQRLGLSRLHRQLFLLIDGKRSTQELARLIGRNHQEVLIVLADLEGNGLIGQ